MTVFNKNLLCCLIFLLQVGLELAEVLVKPDDLARKEQIKLKRKNS